MKFRLFFLSLIATLYLASGVSAAQATLTTVRSGMWEDPSIWSAGRVPTKDDLTVVSALTDVTVTQGTTGLCSVEGSLSVAPGGTLDAWGSVTVDMQGAFSMVTSSHTQTCTLSFHVANDRLFTGNVGPPPDPTMPGYFPNDTGLWAMGGRIDWRGPPVTSWVEASSVANGNATLTTAPQGWQPGDQLVLANPDGSYVTASVISVSGTSLTYTVVAPFTGTPYYNWDRSLTVNPIIANRTRRVVVQSADVREGDPNHRAHCAWMGDGAVRCDYVEFRDLGPRAKLGRYPAHFHQGHYEPGSHLLGCSFHSTISDPGSRFVSVHDTTTPVLITDCVGFFCRGHGYFNETKKTVGHTYARNLSIGVQDGEELTVEGQNNGTHHFWTHAGNIVQDNMAIGGTALGGFAMLGSANNDPARLIGNRAYGTAKYGQWCSVDGGINERPLCVLCRTSGLLIESVDDFTVLNGTLLGNGFPGVNYASQAYCNLALRIKFQGGEWNGNFGTQQHYKTTCQVNGVKLRVKWPVDMTYFQSEVKVQGCDLAAYDPKLFSTGLYGFRQQSPGVLFYIGNTGLADCTFTHPNFVAPPGFTGTNVVTNVAVARQLTSTIPPYTGFIRVLNVNPSKTTWAVWVVGTTEPKQTALAEKESEWGTITSRGYLAGFPPGTYNVHVINPIDGTNATHVVTVVAGAITNW